MPHRDMVHGQFVALNSFTSRPLAFWSQDPSKKEKFPWLIMYLWSFKNNIAVCVLYLSKWSANSQEYEKWSYWLLNLACLPVILLSPHNTLYESKLQYYLSYSVKSKVLTDSRTEWQTVSQNFLFFKFRRFLSSPVFLKQSPKS